MPANCGDTKSTGNWRKPAWTSHLLHFLFPSHSNTESSPTQQSPSKQSSQTHQIYQLHTGKSQAQVAAKVPAVMIPKKRAQATTLQIQPPPSHYEQSPQQQPSHWAHPLVISSYTLMMLSTSTWVRRTHSVNTLSLHDSRSVSYSLSKSVSAVVWGESSWPRQLLAACHISTPIVTLKEVAFRQMRLLVASRRIAAWTRAGWAAIPCTSLVAGFFGPRLQHFIHEPDEGPQLILDVNNAVRFF